MADRRVPIGKAARETGEPFDMAVLNDMDRFHLAIDAIDRLPQLGDRGMRIKRELQDKLVAHRAYIRHYGEDMPEVRNWTWHDARPA